MIGDMLIRIIALINIITSLGYSVEMTQIDGYDEAIYTIEAKMNNSIDLVQILSYNQISGYDTLTEMSSYTEGNIIGTNGMFYDGYGRPSGIVIVDGEVLRCRDTGAPIFVVNNDGEAELTLGSIQPYLYVDGQYYPLHELNEDIDAQGSMLLTEWYARYYDLMPGEVGYQIENNIATLSYEEGNRIELKDMSISNNSYSVIYNTLNSDLPIESGSEVSISYVSNLDIDDIEDAFQTGGWLVKSGVNVAKAQENLIGDTDSLQPRTAIGIKEDGSVIMKVVDGRKSGYSVGVTGKQLAELMIEDGCINAAYLDGGSSSEMVLNNTILNQPSGGEEKVISHGIFIRRTMVAKS